MVERTIKLITDLILEGIATFLRILELLWIWSFGQIVAVFQSDWQALPAWKLILLVLVVGCIIFLLWRSFAALFEAGLTVFKALIEFFGALLSVLPFIIAAGILAFAGGWLIQQVHL